jgi:hypothetical protein
MIMKKLLLIAVLVLTLPASAQLWNTTGSTGIIDESSTALYEFTGQALQFKSGQTGTIVARYPIVSDIQDPGWGSFWLGYAGAGVTVRLKKVNECGNTETTLTTYTGNTESYICISHMFFDEFTWNFAQNSYYLEVTLTRATTSTNPRFHRLQFP